MEAASFATVWSAALIVDTAAPPRRVDAYRFHAVLDIALILAFVWGLFISRMKPEPRRFLGLSGPWIAVLVLTAFWQADAVPELWRFLKLVLIVWLISLALMMASIVRTGVSQPPRWRSLISLAISSPAVNVAAGLSFLWLATVSPSGV